MYLGEPARTERKKYCSERCASYDQMAHEG
ncbi:YdaE family protein [Klebsiella pneumoniae]